METFSFPTIQYESVVSMSVNLGAQPRTLARMKCGKIPKCETLAAVTPQNPSSNVAILNPWQRKGLSRHGGYVQVSPIDR